MEEGPSGLSLRVNPFAADRANLKRSALFRTLAELGGVFDLEKHDVRGIFVVEGDYEAPTGAQVRESLFARYGFKVEGTRIAAESTAWPGNEMGGYGPIPGWEIGIEDLHWFEWLAAKHTTRAYRNSTP